VRSPAVLVVLVAILLAPSAAPAGRRDRARPTSWQKTITPADRTRLRGWRDAWLLGLTQARAEGAGPAIAAEGVLLDPDSAQTPPDLPDGTYRCRTIKLGRQADSASAFATYPGFHCQVANGRFAKLDGPQRPSGGLYPFDGTRLVFLGAMSLGDEARALDYGRDAERNMVGVVERVGPRTWRLVLPKPHWESQIDVIELVPAGS